MRQLQNHVVVCCFSGGAKSPMLGLCNFVMPLRASNFRADQMRTVVILGDYAFLEKEWPSLCNFPAVYVRAVSVRLLSLSACTYSLGHVT